MKVVRIALCLAIVLAGAAPSHAEQRQGKEGKQGAVPNKTEACRAEARRATYAFGRGSGSSPSIVEAQARQARMRAYFLKCMGRSNGQHLRNQLGDGVAGYGELGPERRSTGSKPAHAVHRSHVVLGW